MQRHSALVINWHLTEVCNYSCRYCYAKWHKAAQPRELIHDPRRRATLLAELRRFFQPGNQANPLTRQLAWDSDRLNLAGGEPLLYPQAFWSIIKQARQLGFEVSLITNASQIDRRMLNCLAPQLSWLGISLDAQKLETNQAIGRVDPHGRVLDLDRLIQDLQSVRQRFPALRLKINTVVNARNWHEYLGDLIQRIAPDKWKVLRMLPVIDRRLAISGEEFSAYVNRHRMHADIMYPEDHQDMSESYLMIDPHGRFFQNGRQQPDSGYRYSRKILEVGAAAAFSEMAFNAERFGRRYTRRLRGEAA